MEGLSVAGITEVVVERGLKPPLLPARAERKRVALLTQPGATSRGMEVASILGEEGLSCEVIGVPDREEAKTLDVAASVYEALARFGVSRHDAVVGVGGGSVTDLAGYVAGTWLRGVEAAHFPTTLLASVDAAIGGKTGVNLAGKNLVGVIWHPSRVVIDIDLLEQLPLFLRREGMAEVLKAGLIGDPHLCRLVERDGARADLTEVVTRAVRVKAQIVTEDEREHGPRAHLNLGHTLGHAIELASALSHGESVALGLIAAAHISQKRCGFEELERVATAVESIGLPTVIQGVEVAQIMDLLNYDKKRDARGIRMVLLKRIGEPVMEHVEPADIEVGLAAVGL